MSTIRIRCGPRIEAAKQEEHVCDQRLLRNQAIQWAWAIDAYNLIIEICGDAAISEEAFEKLDAELLRVSSFPNKEQRNRDVRTLADTWGCPDLRQAAE